MTARTFLQVAAVAAASALAGAAQAQTTPPSLAATGLGVICNGRTDTTAALQAAMATAAHGHAALVLPGGVCLASKLVWPAGLAALRGQGLAATVIRRTPDSPSQVLLDIEGVGAFTVADLTLDGNKAANTQPNHDVILNNDWGYTFDHVGAINARGAGRTYGFGFYQVADANEAHGVPSYFVDCVGATNDNGGIGGQEAHSLTIRGGTWRDNGSSGIDWYKPWKPGVTYVRGLTITGVTASGNAAAGIRVAYWGFGPADALPSTAATDVHIEANTVTGNHGAGIVYQASGGTVANNRITGNGSPAGDGTALLFNAVDSRAVNNDIHDNQVFFGIDAGGTVRSVVSGNTIRDNGVAGHGNGLNIGGSYGDVISNNTVSNNGRVQIHFARQEAGGNFFPWDSGATEISGNHVTTVSPAQVGMELLGSPHDLVVKGNVFDGPSPARLVANTSVASQWQSNRYACQSGDFSIRATERLVLPDWVEVAEVTGGGTISTILTETEAANAGKVVDVVMTRRGERYTAPPAVSFSGGGCSGVGGAAKLSGDGRVSQVLVTSPGTGCTSPPGVSLSGGGGTGATAAVPVLGTPLADGRQIALRFTAKTTLAAGGNLRLKGGGAVGVPAGGLITFAARSGDFVETKRNF